MNLSIGNYSFDTATFFTFYKIPVSFLIEEPVLKKKYLEYARILHPDFYTQAEDNSIQENALYLATINNQAYQTLSDFERRMAYILQIKGKISENDKQKALPTEFLMEMMDINEAIDDLSTDNNKNNEGLQRLVEKVAEMEIQTVNQITPLLNGYRENEENDVFWEEIKIFFYKQQYLLRIKKTLRTFAPQL